MYFTISLRKNQYLSWQCNLMYFSLTYLTKNDQCGYDLESSISFGPCQMCAFRRYNAELEMHVKCHWLTWRCAKWDPILRAVFFFLQ